MKTLYFDCIFGIAGDMALAALVDLGADLTYISEQLRKLPIDPFELEILPVNKRGIAAKKLSIHLESQGANQPYHFKLLDDHPHRKAADILHMIESSSLPNRVKQRSMAIFQVIAEAEAKIHGMDPREVHFHEVGAMDSIIDTIGVCLALEYLEIDEVYASPVPTGYGKMKMAHGLYPIPAPATAELLRGIPLADLPVEGELTTPTGAGILKALVKEFRPIGSIKMERIGYGAGNKDFDHPNVVRAILIQEVNDRKRESIYVLETQLDDMTGEALGFAMERLFQEGALDVYYTPVYMKKNRPGTLITVLVQPERADGCEEVLLTQTSTLGVRRSEWTRKILERRIVSVETTYGMVRVKQAIDGDRVLQQAPEYEDVAALARKYNLPFQEVYLEVLRESTP
ncbi:nickel pincer cofactor biosynthesis protein LarC [Ammoniphilus sp. CFH 90114]|uniref:nickel pincer cofactor biosynthesis protein LarC n=1 Tax=Ammoniphilus sp. CFH 90114 TaxID=2493665 RepID=UPI00100E7BB1|nr:nickel pincer cofactor biosynthesis protein LarC [Ammoniphilus sp. CFH 90114]RXT02828.1 nickel pincer cofactor biosynthesis protein LarC [Ammoniphilus sp. CFH 90114]